MWRRNKYLIEWRIFTFLKVFTVIVRIANVPFDFSWILILKIYEKIMFCRPCPGQEIAVAVVGPEDVRRIMMVVITLWYQEQPYFGYGHASLHDNWQGCFFEISVDNFNLFAASEISVANKPVSKCRRRMQYSIRISNHMIRNMISTPTNIFLSCLLFIRCYHRNIRCYHRNIESG